MPLYKVYEYLSSPNHQQTMVRPLGSYRSQNIYYIYTECCMSGCAVCIYDLYMEAKEGYRQSLRTALTQLEEKGVPKELWPVEVVALAEKRKSHPDLEEQGEEDPTMKAFLELERRLKG